MQAQGSLDLARALARSVASDPRQSAGVLAGLAAVALTSPVAALAATLAGGAFLATRSRHGGLPGRGAAAGHAAPGGFSLILGRDREGGRPMVLSRDDALQHMLVLGDTGSGKTEFLMALAEQAAAAGSGVLIVDGKGDASTYAKAFAMAERHGRIDDLLVVDFMSPGGSASNTFNPFATGTADEMARAVKAIMENAGPDAAAWKGHAASLLPGLMESLAHMRDVGTVTLSPATVLAHLDLASVIGLSNGDVPEAARARIRDYLSSLPGYNPDRGARQAQSVLDRHGMLMSMLVPPLRQLGETYAHVFRPGPADVDIEDAVRNGRIVVVLLPALDKSGEEMSRLGRIVVATLKGMMASSVPHRRDGKWEDIVDVRVPSRPPFLCVLDEVGLYAVEGLALMAAQARSLGFAMVYGSRDMEELRRTCPTEAASIVANTNTRVLMRSGPGPFMGGPYDPATVPMTFDLAPGEAIVLFKGEGRRLRLSEPGRERPRLDLRANHLVTLREPKA